MKKRLGGLIVGLIHGTILWGIVWGLSWLLKALFSVPSFYSLAALVALPWIMLVICWCVCWFLVLVDSTFGGNILEGEAVSVLVRFILGGDGEASYADIMSRFTSLALAGAVLGATRWALDIESPLGMALIGGTWGGLCSLVFHPLRSSKGARHLWVLIRSVVVWVATATATFVDTISLDGETLITISRAFFVDNAPRLVMILLGTVVTTGLLGLALPPEPPASKPAS